MRSDYNAFGRSSALGARLLCTILRRLAALQQQRPVLDNPFSTVLLQPLKPSHAVRGLGCRGRRTALFARMAVAGRLATQRHGPKRRARRSLDVVAGVGAGGPALAAGQRAGGAVVRAGAWRRD